MRSVSIYLRVRPTCFLCSTPSMPHWSDRLIDLCHQERSAESLAWCGNALKFTVFTDHVGGPGRALGALCLCVRAITFEWSDLWPRYLAGWFNVAMSSWSSNVKVTGQSSRSMEENVAKVVGATSSEGFLVARKSVPKCDKVNNRPPSKRNTGIGPTALLPIVPVIIRSFKNS